MNTVRSFWIGWGSLCAAGGGAYFFAKRSINADREARLEEQRKKKCMMASLERGSSQPGVTVADTRSPEATAVDNDGLVSPTGAAAAQLQTSRGPPLPTTHGPGT